MMTDYTPSPEAVEAGARALCRIVWGIERDDFGRIMDRAPYCQEHNGRLDAEDHCECGTKVATAVLTAATPLIGGAVREQVAVATVTDNPAAGMSHNGPVSYVDALLAGVFARHQIGSPNLCLCTYSATPCTSLELARALLDQQAEICTARERGERIEAVRALHRPEQRWQPSPDAEFSFGSREDVIEGWCECGAVCTCEPSSFVICAECGRVESGDDQRPYRESLWPCPTIRALGDGGET